METYENFDVLQASLAQCIDELIDEISVKVGKGDEVTELERTFALHRILNHFTVYQVHQDLEMDDPVVLN